MAGSVVESRVEELLPELRQASAYPDATDSVDLIETHISWVFLTRRHVYKVKKPVQFDFVDFHTLEQRRAACHAELELNRRMAEDVYLGVVPIIIEDSGRVIVDPPQAAEGSTVEWAVKMRRLPAAVSLDRLLLEGNLDLAWIPRIIEHLSAFFHSAKPTSLSPEQYLNRFESHIRDNHEVLAGTGGPHRVARITGAQLQFLTLHPSVLTQRVASGRVIDGHGDLRAEHIYLDKQPVVIDCIEFNPELRQVDIAAELGFLQVECDALQAFGVGKEIASSCLGRLHDHPSAELREFYKCYRACVRAKVAALRAGSGQQGATDSVQRYLELAEGYCQHFTRPLLVIVRGLMGTGKSTLATALSERLGAAHFSTDAIRREIFGPSERPAAYGEENYAAANRRRVYDLMLRHADEALQDRRSVILDGTFLKEDHRLAAAALAAQQGAVNLIIECQCPDHIARQRIDQRRSASNSEARAELHHQQRQEEEQHTFEVRLRRIDTTRPFEVTVREAIDALRQYVAASCASDSSDISQEVSD